MFTSLKLQHFALGLGLLTGVAAGAIAGNGLPPAQADSITQPSSSAPQQVSQSLSLPSSRIGYRPIELDRVAENRDRLVGEVPSAVVAQLFGSREALSASGSEQIQVRYPQPGQAVVVLTKVGLADDSVGGLRYRVELTTRDSEATPQWQVMWVGQQFKCQPGRGSQVWTRELCF